MLTTTETVKKVKFENPQTTIEILIPDFKFDKKRETKATAGK